jgi:hypothetical protein
MSRRELFGWTDNPFTTKPIEQSEVLSIFEDRGELIGILEDTLDQFAGQGVAIYGERGIGVTSFFTAWASRQRHPRRIIIRRRLAGRDQLDLESQMFQAVVDLYNSSGSLPGFRLRRVRAALVNARRDSTLYRRTSTGGTSRLNFRVFSNRIALSIGAVGAALAGLVSPAALAALPVLLALSYVSGTSVEENWARERNPEAKRLIFGLLENLSEELHRQSPTAQGVVVFDFGDWNGPASELKGWFNDMTHFAGQLSSIHYVYLLNSAQKSRIDEQALMASAPARIRLEPLSEAEFLANVDNRIRNVTPQGLTLVNPISEDLLRVVYRRTQGNTFEMMQACARGVSHCVANSERTARHEWLLG